MKNHKKNPYRVVLEDTCMVDQFEEKCASLIREGYEPLGGVVIAQDTRREGGENFEVTQLCQAFYMGPARRFVEDMSE